MPQERSELCAAALAGSAAAAADDRSRLLVEGFVHQAGPPPDAYAWVALGSHARGELHCTSDQDHALVWATDRAAASRYAADLAAAVISGLAAFGMRRCDGGYMADAWSRSLPDWVARLREQLRAPTPQAVLDTDVFLDLRRLAGAVDIAPMQGVLLAGADSPRLLHGLAVSANRFPVPLGAFGRLPAGPIDVKRSGLVPLVLLARLYGLQARTTAVGTADRLRAAVRAGVLSPSLGEALVAAGALLAGLRLASQRDGRPVVARDLAPADAAALREAFAAIRTAQSAAAMAHRADL
jgi:CBS domain-containing protein